MIIDRIELHGVGMPACKPFTTAFGENRTFDGVLVKLCAGEAWGWGEALPWKHPAYLEECAATQFAIAREVMAPLLLGQDIASGADLQRRLSGIRGNRFAKAGFDLAWWDLQAKAQGVPLWRLVGGVRGAVDVGADIGVMDTLDDLLREVQQAVDDGYPRIKLKARPGWDLNMVQAVRGAFPDTVIHIDCNSAYTLADVDLFRKLDAYNLAMIEQPLAHDDLVDHAALQARLRTPICLDESITTVDKARKAAQLGACRWVNIKLGRTGGLTCALAVHDVCRDAGIPCWVGSMAESAIGANHNMALATLPNIAYPADIFPSSRFYVNDVGLPAVTLSAPGQCTPQAQAGIGVEPDVERLAQVRWGLAVLKGEA